MELKDIFKAQERIGGTVHHTPLMRSFTFSDMTGNDVFMKCENLQRTGSFKVRGAYNKIVKLVEDGKKPKFVVTASAGNHAQGVAYAASVNGIEACIVMPRTAPIAKINATEGYGARVVLEGDFYDDACLAAKRIAKEEGGTYIHAFDDEDVIAGQGTIGLEILADKIDVDMVVVPVGGGGLLAGIACAIKNINPKIKIVGVQGEKADAVVQSFKRHEHVSLDSIATIADGIAVKNPGKITVEYINKYVDDMVTVSDNEIAAAIMLLIERSKQVVEPAGATSLAHILSEKFALKGKNIVTVLSGGNIDVGFVHKIIEKGLVNRGRQMKFAAVLDNRPGSLTSFSKVMSDNNANIISLQLDCISKHLNINETIVHIMCEVAGFEHGQRLLTALRSAGYTIEEDVE